MLFVIKLLLYDSVCDANYHYHSMIMCLIKKKYYTAVQFVSLTSSLCSLIWVFERGNNYKLPWPLHDNSFDKRKEKKYYTATQFVSLTSSLCSFIWVLKKKKFDCVYLDAREDQWEITYSIAGRKHCVVFHPCCSTAQAGVSRSDQVLTTSCSRWGHPCLRLSSTLKNRVW